ncbi:MAG: inositol monophosphatase [Kofleriaceae bacterium]|nr:inositol monophosphatase [Myxococcales bacterium]MCB9572135.1 inositol monophosphatase [Kofleriaceae bacterium]
MAPPAPDAPAALDLDALLEVAREVVAEACGLLAAARPAEIRTKSNPRDLVTEWDTRSEELVRTRLAARTPSIPFLGEEGGASGGAVGDGPRWLLDPIDGTVNFAHGLPFWAVSLALMVGGTSQVGVVAAPALGWTFWARRGGGARYRIGGDDGALAVSAIDRVAASMLVTGFPYDRAHTRMNNFTQWEHFQRTAGACRRLGAASLDLAMVARGWLEGYWERKLKPWDIAAGTLLVEEAGGRVTDTRGGPLDVMAGEVVATNGAIHQEMLDELGKADATQARRDAEAGA